MARSKLDEHRLREVELDDLPPGEELELGPFKLELVHMTHSIPDSCAVVVGPSWGGSSSPATTSSTRRRWTAWPADVSRLAELGAEGVLLLFGDSTNADRPGFSPSESGVGRQLEEVFSRVEGRIIVTSFASNIHRVQQVIDAVERARPQGGAGGPLDAQERQHRPLTGPHRVSRGDADPASGGRGLAR